MYIPNIIVPASLCFGIGELWFYHAASYFAEKNYIYSAWIYFPILTLPAYYYVCYGIQELWTGDFNCLPIFLVTNELENELASFLNVSQSNR